MVPRCEHGMGTPCRQAGQGPVRAPNNYQHQNLFCTSIIISSSSSNSLTGRQEQ